jgi:hypothetical protein
MAQRRASLTQLSDCHVERSVSAAETSDRAPEAPTCSGQISPRGLRPFDSALGRLLVEMTMAVAIGLD